MAFFSIHLHEALYYSPSFSVARHTLVRIKIGLHARKPSASGQKFGKKENMENSAI